MSYPHEDKIKFLETKANDIRESIIEMLVEAGSGHTAGPLGMADIFTAFYFHILNHDPRNTDWPERDRLILLQGHPHRTALPGVETTSGPLGSGLGQAAGIAYGARMDKKKFQVYCFMSDGEQEAGNTWEAAMFAVGHKT